MEGVTYSGVSKTLNCLCVWSCICIYRWGLSTSGWPTTSGRGPFRSLSQYKLTISPNCCLFILIQGVSGWQTGGGGEGYRDDGILNSCAFVCNCACTHVSTIFLPYIMPNGTYERIKKNCDTLPLTDNHFSKKPSAERGGTPPPLNGKSARLFFLKGLKWCFFH